MPSAFVDTGAWLALVDPTDKNHGAATQVFRSLAPRTRLYTTNYVISETVTYLVYHKQRPAALRLKQLTEAAEQQSLLTIDWIDTREHELAWSYIEEYTDQQFSFCDCTGFIVAATRRVDFVFGVDNDFRTIGFDVRPGPG